jgi:hypothetical protein
MIDLIVAARSPASSRWGDEGADVWRLDVPQAAAAEEGDRPVL